jgi:hypothetical protein
VLHGAASPADAPDWLRAAVADLLARAGPRSGAPIARPRIRSLHFRGRVSGSQTIEYG